jgi:hypothetical protein
MTLVCWPISPYLSVKKGFEMLIDLMQLCIDLGKSKIEDGLLTLTLLLEI